MLRDEKGSCLESSVSDASGKRFGSNGIVKMCHRRSTKEVRYSAEVTGKIEKGRVMSVAIGAIDRLDLLLSG